MNGAETNLLAFIRAAKHEGRTDEFIAGLLKAAGWTDSRIGAAFTTYYEDPEPASEARIGRWAYAWDGFTFLMSFVTLLSFAYAVGGLLGVLLGRWHERAGQEELGVPIYTAAAGHVVVILAAFPLFLLFFAAMSVGLRKQPRLFDSPVRAGIRTILRIITGILAIGIVVALPLLVAALLMSYNIAGALILSAMVAATIVAYYIVTVRARPSLVRDRTRVFTAVVSGIFALALVFGFIDVGAAVDTQAMMRDDTRVTRLGNIRNAIGNRYASAIAKKHTFALPRDIAATGPFAAAELEDPLTGEPFRYVPLGGARYRLCAGFERPSDFYERQYADPSYEPHDFPHDRGTTCFDLDAEDEL
jgi:MFS family permease